MFRFTEKLKYIVLGGLLTCTGFIFGSMNRIDADSESKAPTVVGELTVQKLRVLERIVLYDKDQTELVIIDRSRRGGSVSVRDAVDGTSSASLLIGREGGEVVVTTNRGTLGSAGLSTSVGNGIVYVTDRIGIKEQWGD